ADAAVVEKSVDAAAALPGLGGCADAQGLLAEFAPPRDEATAARVRKARALIADADALFTAQKVKEALLAAGVALPAAKEARYLPVEAEALEILGKSQLNAGDYKSAEGTL